MVTAQNQSINFKDLESSLELKTKMSLGPMDQVLPVAKSFTKTKMMVMTVSIMRMRSSSYFLILRI